MIDRQNMVDIVNDYSDIRIGVLGSHSALEVMDGAKDENLKTVVICEKGREGPYRRFSRIADEIMVLDSFSDMASAKTQKIMRDSGTIIVPHRSFTAYLGYDTIENTLQIPIFGNRSLLRAEERSEAKGQYHLLKEAGIRYPRIYNDPKDIDGPCIVKVQERDRPLERAFFTVSSYDDYTKKAEQRIDQGVIARSDLEEAVIEELVVGTYMNFNFFHTPISDAVDFIGIERRLQTNIHDYNALPAELQLGIPVGLQNIEVGHTPASIRESLLDKVFAMGDKFVDAVKREYPPGIIGPFSLQSVVTKELDLVVYDVSLRVPGNPIVSTTTPYTKYQYGHTFGVGRRIAMEIKRAIDEGSINQIVT